MITLVAGMIVSSNCSLFLVFHMWVSIVVVSFRVSFFAIWGFQMFLIGPSIYLIISPSSKM